VAAAVAKVEMIPMITVEMITKVEIDGNHRGGDHLDRPVVRPARRPVGHVLAREKEERKAKVLRLTMLGWTNEQAAQQVDVTEGTIRTDRKDSESGLSAIRQLLADKHGRDEVARRFNLPPVLVEAIGLDGAVDGIVSPSTRRCPPHRVNGRGAGRDPKGGPDGG